MSTDTPVSDLALKIHQQAGFITAEDLVDLARLSRLTPCLIRWHEGRATAPAQDVARLIDATTRGGWCVRDVSLPAGVSIVPEAPLPRHPHVPPRDVAKRTPRACDSDDFGGAFDGFTVTSDADGGL